MNTTYPKISIVTPVYNQVTYIETTIKSVIAQNYPNLEYIIVDGGSTDGTLEIIKHYEGQITNWISEPDNGMYDALNKGFKLSTGDIMGWINGDDILLPGALFNVARVCNDLPQVSWFQGLNCIIDLEGNIVNTIIPKRFSLITFLNGDYRWIQQESTFWRRDTWVKSGNQINDNLKLAGDFDLWFKFFQFEKLFYVTIPLGAFRKRPGQLSDLHMDKYTDEVHDIIISHSHNKEQLLTLKKIRWISFIIRTLEKLKVFNLSYFINKRDKLLQIGNIDIRYSHKEQKYII